MPVTLDHACLDQIAAGGDVEILQADYRPRLLCFAQMMGVPTQDCADLVQEVLLVAIRDTRAGLSMGRRHRRAGVLERKPADLRMILLLNETEGLTLVEISRRLRRPQGMLGRKLAEPKKVFRRELSLSQPFP